MAQQKGDLPRVPVDPAHAAEVQARVAQVRATQNAQRAAMPGGLPPLAPEMMKALQAKLNQRAIRQLVVSSDGVWLYIICSDNTLWAAKNPVIYNEDKADWSQINVPPQPESVLTVVPEVEMPVQAVSHEMTVETPSEPKPLG